MTSNPSEQRLKPGLYVVATPIGNLADLSPRAAFVLAAAVLIAAEDTRTSGPLVKRAGGTGRLVSLTEHNVEARAAGLIAAAREGVVALVSDAGTPAVSDPGARLVEAAHAGDVAVFAVAGPSALAAAVSVSGFDGSDVHFLGFLPRTRAERRARLSEASRVASTLVFFESPGRVAATLEDVATALGDPEVCVCRELTKLHEETVRGRASTMTERFREGRGEFTVVVRSPAAAQEDVDESQVRDYMAGMQRAGARRSGAAAEAARRFGVGREVAYALWDGAAAES